MLYGLPGEDVRNNLDCLPPYTLQNTTGKPHRKFQIL